MIRNLLLVIDIQLEYIMKGRPFFLNGIQNSLTNCEKVLALARRKKWEVAHVQHSNGDTAPRFNPTTEFFKFAPGFFPAVNEKHFVKNDFSCYSSDDFSRYMQSLHIPGTEVNTYIIGYNSVMCCLSTLEEARRRKHKMFFIEDASLAKSIGDQTEVAMHKVMVDVYRAKSLATIITTEKLQEMFKVKEYEV